MNLLFRISAFWITLLVAVTGWSNPVAIPRGMDHSTYDTLLRKYVDEQGLVDYARWKANPGDLEALQAYLRQYASKERPFADGDEAIASLVNAYNAFTLSFILENYPTESIRQLSRPFNGKRYLIAGQKVSADDIEHRTLRPLIGWKAHAMLVCAAQSCPPLLAGAYTAQAWTQQMEDRYRAWLGREDMNAYLPAMNQVELSEIFRWYVDDYEGEHSIERLLLRYGPEAYADFFRKGGYAIKYLDYRWGLNDQSGLGNDYKHGLLRGLLSR